MFGSLTFLVFTSMNPGLPPFNEPQKTEANELKMPLAEPSDEVSITLDSLAKDLCGLLAHPGIRNHLRSEIKKSSKRENILFLEEFLSGLVKVQGLPEQARKKTVAVHGKAQSAKKRFNETNIREMLASPEIDVYFPVKKHQEKWTGNDDLLIGTGTLKESKQIKVYSVKTGQSKMIGTSTPPQEPVLMVSPCEHQSHEAQPELQTQDVPAVQPGSDDGQNSYIQTNYFYITTTSEPWYCGDPEIYTLVAQYSSAAHLVTVKKYLPGVNNAGVWKHLANCPTALSFYWDNTYNVITYFKVMEEDTGNLGTISVSVYGVTVKFPVRNDDDDMGSVNVNRDQVGWCPYGTLSNCCSSWTTQVSTGKALMRMTKVH